MRRRGLFPGLVLITILLTAVGGPRAENRGTPLVVLPEQVVDLGEVREGKTIQHAFTVLNRGDQTLLIRDVKPG